MRVLVSAASNHEAAAEIAQLTDRPVHRDWTQITAWSPGAAREPLQDTLVRISDGGAGR